MECIYCKKDCYKKGKRNGTQRGNLPNGAFYSKLLFFSSVFFEILLVLVMNKQICFLMRFKTRFFVRRLPNGA